MGIEPVDPLTLRLAARSERKSMGRFSRLVKTSLGLVWSSGRWLFISLIALQTLGGIALAAQVVVIQSVLNAILLVQAGSREAAMLGPILLLAALTAVSTATMTFQGQMQRLLGENVALRMWDQVLHVASDVDLEHFESPDFYNRLSRVQTSALARPLQVTQGLLTLAGGLVAAVSLGLALLSVSPSLLPLVVIGGIPVLLTSRRESRLEFEFSVRQTPVVRLRNYFMLLQTGHSEAKEVRAFGLGDWLRGRFDSVYRAHLQELRRHVQRRSWWSVLGQLGAALMLVMTLLVLVRLIAQRQIGIAGAGAAIVAIRMLGTQVQLLFGGVQSIFESGLFLDDFNDFLALGREAKEKDTGTDAPSRFTTLQVDNLSFRYADSAVDALRGVDLVLHAGEVAALVGENGSGKTTLAKLLAGLYSPAGGRISWDGRDTTTFRPSSLRQRVTVVFQDFVRYALSGTENIAVGRIDEPVDPDRVRGAARYAGVEASLDALPAGFDTVLSRLFAGGRDLSGGQWQRIALARCFYRDAPLVILDEPSASLDPRAEHALFSTLREALQGRTALFISHRFSTVRGADRIFVMHEGTIVEQGSHDELVELDGRYAELYRLQSDAFISGGSGEVYSGEEGDHATPGPT